MTKQLPEKLPKAVTITKDPFWDEQRDADQFVYDKALERIAELERYDIRQYIPDGKYCGDCPLITNEQDDACGFLHDFPEQEEVSNGANSYASVLIKLPDCPIPAVLPEGER